MQIICTFEYLSQNFISQYLKLKTFKKRFKNLQKYDIIIKEGQIKLRKENNKWQTKWTGDYPNLCSGNWILYKNGKELNVDIPFNKNIKIKRLPFGYKGKYIEENGFYKILIGKPANTFGEYQEWYFNDDSLEEFKFYKDGLKCDEWCETHKEWLKTIAPESEWHSIFEAFQENDWRHDSCGGCI